jgi:hypothetical protein
MTYELALKAVQQPKSELSSIKTPLFSLGISAGVSTSFQVNLVGTWMEREGPMTELARKCTGCLELGRNPVINIKKAY